MSKKNRVELNVVLNTKDLDKDFDKLGKEAKSGAKTAADALDDMQDAIKETSEQSQKSSKEMESASDKLIASIRAQESELSELKKTYLDTAITQGKSSDEAKELGDKIELMSAELQNNRQKLKDAEYSVEDLGSAAQELGEDLDDAKEKASIFGDVLKGSLASAAIEKSVEMVASGVSSFVSGAMEMQDANQKLQASTGATKEEMEAYSDTLEDIYKNNYGDSVEDVADAMALVRQYTGEVDPTKLQELAENAMALDDTFENMDMSETLRGADALMKRMGLTAEEAFDYITAGAQNGLNKSGELVDNLAEYVPLWEQAGFSAEEMFTILDNGLKSGAYNLDIVNDFVKEFGISLSDGRIEDNLASFSSGTQELFYQWKDGEATTKDVFYSVINNLQNMTNQQEALTLASNVWSAVGEDNAMEVLTSLNKVNDTFIDVKGSMESLKEVRYDSLSNQYKTLGRAFQTSVSEPILKKFLPVAQSGVELLAGNIDSIVPVATAAGAAVGTMWVANKARKFISEVKDTAKSIGALTAKLMAKNAATATGTTVETAATAAAAANTAANTGQAAATGAATVAQQGLNAAMMANPAMLVVGGITALISVLAVLGSNIQDATDETSELCSETEETNKKIKESTDSLKESYGGLEESIDSISAKEAMADDLITELYELEKTSDGSRESIAKMSVKVDELNAMFPELSLEIDKNTGALSKNEEQTRSSIDTYLQYSKVQAAQEKVAEIAGELADADMERYGAEKKLAKIGDELTKLEEERTKLLEESTEATKDGTKACGNYAAKLSGEETALIRNTAQINRLKKEQGALQDSLETLQEVQDEANQKYAEAYDYVESLTEKTKENAEVKNEASRASIEQAGQELEAYNSLSAAQQELAVNVTNSVLSMQENVQSSLESQMSMFEKFDGGTKISTERLLKNMQSQVDGVTAWEENLTALMTKTKETSDGTMVAIDEGLMQYLASMGPEGASYVQAFVNMSGDELAKANSLWQEKVAIESFTNEAGIKLTDGIGTLSAGGVEAFNQLGTDLNMEANEAGNYSVQGLVDGMEEAQVQAEATSKDLGVKVIDSLNEGLGCQSPSKKAKESGKNTDAGLIEGIISDIRLVEVAGTKLGTTAIEALKACDMYDEAYKVGVDFGSGMEDGILSKAKSVADQAAALVRNAINAAKQEQDSNSPAKETIKLGHDFGDGAELGIEDRIPAVAQASADMMQAALSAPDDKWAISAINDAVYNRSVSVGRLYAGGISLPGNSGERTADNTKYLAKELGAVFAKEIEGMGFMFDRRQVGRLVRECHE